MDATKELLAKVIAEAVEAESQKFEAWKVAKLFYVLPNWYQPAVDALAAYSAEQDLEKNLVNY